MNRSKGDCCENLVLRGLLEKCDFVAPLSVGADFVCCEGRKTTFIEVKCNKSGLTKAQQKFKKMVEKEGFKYKIERCRC